MGSLSNTYANNVLDAVFGPGFSKPTNLYIALYTVAPTASGGGSEVSGSGYARAGTTNDAATWPYATGGQKKNASIITFPQATGSGWGTIVAFALFDQATAGTMVTWGSLGTPKAVAAGETPQFAANALVITAS